MTSFAAIQMVSTDQVNHNLQTVALLIQRAVDEGASCILLPENFAFVGKTELDKLSIQENFGHGPIQDFLAQQAQYHGIYIIAGTIALSCEQNDKVNAACLVYDPNGRCIKRYNKIHLFDVTVGELQYHESTAIAAGDEVAVVSIGEMQIALSICYDLRFPELYRSMHNAGINVIVVPAAFTQQTGQLHWQALLQARAIENLCYVVAANQGGVHSNQRETYGHSMIIHPWGQILVQAEKGEDVIISDINIDEVQQYRCQFPCLSHTQIKVEG